MKTNCANCGAPLKYDKDCKICQCAYCGTEYIVDYETKRLSESTIEIYILGKKRKFYIGDIIQNKIFGNAYRNNSGELVRNEIASKVKLNLIEM